jgi:hypothetical protein
VFLAFLVSNIIFTQDNGGDNSNRNTRTDLNPTTTLTTETSTHNCTLLSREEGEDEDTSQTALKLSRITITASISANDKGETPQWMVDALKVGPVHATILKSLMSRRITPHILSRSDQYLPSLNNSKPTSLPKMLYMKRVSRDLVAYSMVLSPSWMKPRHGPFKGMISLA